MEHEHCTNCEAMHAHDPAHMRTLFVKTVLAFIVGTGLFACSMFDLLPAIDTADGLYLGYVLAGISLGILIFCGGHFFTGAWQAFKVHYATMDTLIAIGTGAAWLYSCIVLLFVNDLPAEAQNVYFESTVVIIALVNLGMLIEARARRKTSQAIEKLLTMQPKTVLVIRDNKDIEIPLADVQINYLIRIRPGEQIPVDGEIIEGNSTIDESMLSGEPMPVSKKIGDKVTAGTLNKDGSFVFKALAIGKDTVLAHIVDMVQQAQNTKPKLARLADRIAAVFVPLVLIIAVVTALIWYNIGIDNPEVFMLITSLSVLVIACPCALGLAVPISVMVGIGKAAQNGILITHANALQEMTKLTTIIIDKTGTITLGKPRIINIFPSAETDMRAVLSLATSIELGSEHPYANAIKHAAANEKLNSKKTTNFQAYAGLGATAEIAGEPVSIGNASFMEAQLVSVDGFKQQSIQCAEYGQTLLYVSRNKRIVGALSIADPIKPEAKDAIDKLKKMGLKVIMITGDQHATSISIAKRVGIEEVIAEVMPQEKNNKIKELQEQGEIVAMVGDGINDAPALAQANVGMAIGTGTDIAIQSADVTLVSGNLNAIVTAISIARNTVENMKQNLFAAFIYNIIGIPIAAGALYPFIGILLSPMLAGVAMALSSLTVVSNANRLRFMNLNHGSSK